MVVAQFAVKTRTSRPTIRRKWASCLGPTRTPHSKQRAVARSVGKPARTAKLELRYAQVELKAPVHKTKYLGLDKPLVLWLVIAQEVVPHDLLMPRIIGSEVKIASGELS